LRNEKGGTLIELVMVMSLLVLFGFAVYSLVCEGSQAQKRLDSEKSAETNARVAASYVDVRLRQNDAGGKISVEPNGLNGRDSIVIRYRYQDDPDDDYDVWIYWANGELREVLSMAGVTPHWDSGNDIAAVDGFYVSVVNGVVSFTVEYAYEGTRQKLSETVYLRSGPAQSAGVGSE